MCSVLSVTFVVCENLVDKTEIYTHGMYLEHPVILKQARDEVFLRRPSDGNKVLIVLFVESFCGEPTKEFSTVIDSRRAAEVFTRLISYCF